METNKWTDVDIISTWKQINGQSLIENKMLCNGLMYVKKFARNKIVFNEEIKSSLDYSNPQENGK